MLVQRNLCGPVVMVLAAVSIMAANCAPVDWAPVTQRPGCSRPEVVTTRQSPGEYVHSEEEFERILAGLREEAQESAIHNLGNYVGDEVPLDDLLKLLGGEVASEQDSGAKSTPERAEGATSGRESSGDQALSVASHDEGSSSSSTSSDSPRELPTPGTEPDGSPDAGASETPLPVVESQAEWEEITRRLRDEALSTSLHPANYVSSEEELKFIIEKLSESEDFLDSRLERWEKDLPLLHDSIVCAICLSEIETDERRELLCGHSFHRECIREWSRHKRPEKLATCPTCREPQRTFFH